MQFALSKTVEQGLGGTVARTVAIGIVASVLVLVWSVTFRPTFLGGPAGFILVSGASMEPTLHTGDLVITRRQPDYDPGDVVAFRSGQGIVIHRIIGGSGEAGFVMQGDNKENPDSWRPQASHIVGKQWLHAPAVGKLIAQARQPHALGLILCVAAFTILARQQKMRRPERMKRRRTMRKLTFGTPQMMLLPRNRILILMVAILACIFSGVCAIYVFRQPTSVTEFNERLAFAHNTNFGYTVHTEPSTIYPDGVIGPITDAQAGESDPGVPPIYTRLVDRIDIGIVYEFDASQPADLSGEIGVDLEVGASDGWKRVFELLPPRPFEGSGTSVDASVELASIQELIDSVEEETGFSPGSYELRVIPKVSIGGRVGENPFDSQHMSPFVFTYSGTEIVAPVELSRTDNERIGETVHRANSINLLGASVSISLARGLTSAVFLISAVVAASAACVVFLGAGLGELERIRSRYGSMLIEVTDADLNGWGATVEVASIGELARLAKRDGGIIFHHDLGEGSRRFFVPDGQTTYQYTVSLSPPRWSPQAVVAEGD